MPWRSSFWGIIRPVLTGALVFGVTYLLVSLRRLQVLPIGRPGGALIGAVATIALGLLDAKGALGAIDGHTIVLVFRMMAIGAFLELDGFFARAALATAANTGSVATVVGNPQNMLCASLGGFDYRTHFVALLPVAIVGLALNHLFLVVMFRNLLDIPLEPPAER